MKQLLLILFIAAGFSGAAHGAQQVDQSLKNILTDETGFYCFHEHDIIKTDLYGNFLWKTEIKPYPGKDNKILGKYLFTATDDRPGVAALNKSDGTIVWRTVYGADVADWIFNTDKYVVCVTCMNYFVLDRDHGTFIISPTRLEEPVDKAILWKDNLYTTSSTGLKTYKIFNKQDFKIKNIKESSNHPASKKVTIAHKSGKNAAINLKTKNLKTHKTRIIHFNSSFRREYGIIDPYQTTEENRIIDIK